MSLEKYKLFAIEKLRRSAVMTAVAALPLCIMLGFVFALLSAFADAAYHIATVVILTSAVVILFIFITQLMVRNIQVNILIYLQ